MSCRVRVEPGSLQAGRRDLDGAEHHYVVRVRRMVAGDTLILFDGAGVEAAATIERITPHHVTVHVAEPRARAQTSGFRLTVAQALLKGDRMDWCIQKLVELGASEIIPLRTARTVVDVRGERAARRHQRYQSIAQGAARQCGRPWLPTIEKIVDLHELWGRAAGYDQALFLWEGETERLLAQALPVERPSHLCLIVGPEGGFDAAEVAAARAAGFTTAGLGPYILRAETAALAAAAWIGFRYGDLGGRG